MGKFFKLAKSNKHLVKDDNPAKAKEMNRAIAERALVKTIDPGAKTDSIGFFKGHTVDKILKENLSSIPKNLRTGVDSWKAKNVARNYWHTAGEGQDYSVDNVLKYVGFPKKTRTLVNLENTFSGTGDKKITEFRKNLKASKKRHLYNQKHDVTYKDTPHSVDGVAYGEEDKYGG